MRKFLLGLTCLATISTSAIAQKTVTVKSGELTLRTDTRVTFDGALYLPGTSTSGWRWGEEDFHFKNGANITQARFGIWGSLGEKWTGKFDIKIANRQVLLQDVFLDYKIKPKSLYIRAGYYVDPVSVEANAASSFLSLNSPSALSMLAHQTRFLTLSLTSFSKHHYLVGGLYGSSLGPHKSSNGGSDAWGVTIKGAYLPINEEGSTLYLGAYGRYRKPDYSLTGKNNVMKFATHSGSTIDGRAYVSGELQDVSAYSILGAEFAMTRGRFHLMGEYLVNNIYFKKNNAYQRERAFFHGGYLTASYMIFGRQRKYLDYWGIFSPLANVPATGNLELIGRISYVNANDKGKSNQADIQMGQSWVATLGLNWYPYKGNLLIGLNYNYSIHDKYARAMGQLSGPNQDNPFNFHTLQCRLQFVF